MWFAYYSRCKNVWFFNFGDLPWAYRSSDRKIVEQKILISYRYITSQNIFGLAQKYIATNKRHFHYFEDLGGKTVKCPNFRTGWPILMIEVPLERSWPVGSESINSQGVGSLFDPFLGKNCFCGRFSRPPKRGYPWSDFQVFMHFLNVRSKTFPTVPLSFLSDA